MIFLSRYDNIYIYISMIYNMLSVFGFVFLDPGHYRIAVLIEIFCCIHLGARFTVSVLG